MCVAAPEDPPQNVLLRNITSKSLSLIWDPPKITTGRFSYIIQLHSSEGNTPWPSKQMSLPLILYYQTDTTLWQDKPLI